MRHVARATGPLALLLLGLLVAGCSTPYQAEQAGGMLSRAGGFSDRQLGPYAWRVVYAGNGYTSQETAEQGFLTRAADLTLSAGGDFFVVMQSNLSVYPGGQAARARGIGAYGNFFGGAGYPTYNTGWGGWSGFDQPAPPTTSPYGGPQADGIILIYKGQAPADLPDAYEARKILR